MAIPDWPAHDRPREKLCAQGAHNLSDTELLAIFLRTGCTGLSAVDLARNLINQFGNLRGLLEASQEEFCQQHGLGAAKYAQLQAVLEMARRHLAQDLSQSQVFPSSRSVKNFLRSKLRHLNHEVFAALFLDTQHHLISYTPLFKGTINAATVYPREVLKETLRQNATAVILVHNHPSGRAEPSDSDLSITRTLVQSLNLIDIHVLDHIIVGEGECYSFAEHGLI